MSVKKRHITLTLARLFEKTTLGAWEQYWDSICRSGVCGESVSAVTPLTEEQTTDEYWQGEPFVLTLCSKPIGKGVRRGKRWGRLPVRFIWSWIARR